MSDNENNSDKIENNINNNEGQDKNSRRSFLKGLGLTLASHFVFLNIFTNKGFTQEKERIPPSGGGGEEEEPDPPVPTGTEKCPAPGYNNDSCFSTGKDDTCHSLNTSFADPDCCGLANSHGNIITDSCGSSDDGPDYCGYIDVHGDYILDQCDPLNSNDPDFCDPLLPERSVDICETWIMEECVTCEDPIFIGPPLADYIIIYDV